MRPPAPRARGFALALLALFVALALAPTAAADHVYTHRYLLTGQVVDADGYPVSNLTLRAHADSGIPTQSGQPEQSFRIYGTDCSGRFGWNVRDEQYRSEATPGVIHAFLHLHTLSERGTLAVHALNVTYPETLRYPWEGEHRDTAIAIADSDAVMAATAMPVDPVARESHVVLQLNESRPDLRCPQEAEAFATEYRVSGRLMRETAPKTVEGVPVESEPIPNETIALTLRYNNGQEAEATATTDRDGLYAHTFQLPATLQEGDLTVAWNGTSRTLPADPIGRSQAVFLRNPIPQPVTSENDDGDNSSRNDSGNEPPNTHADTPATGALATLATLGAAAAARAHRRR